MRHPVPHAARHPVLARTVVGVLRFGGSGDGSVLDSFADAFAAFINRAGAICDPTASAAATVAERVSADAFHLVTASAFARGPTGRRVKALLAALAWARGRAMERCLLGDRWPMLGIRTPLVMEATMAALAEDPLCRMLLEDAVARPLLTSRATSVSLHDEPASRAVWSAAADTAAHYAAHVLREPMGGVTWERVCGRLHFGDGLLATLAHRGTCCEVLVAPRVLRLLTLVGVDRSIPHSVRAVVGHTRHRSVHGHVTDSRLLAEIDLRSYMLGG